MGLIRVLLSFLAAGATAFSAHAALAAAAEPVESEKELCLKILNVAVSEKNRAEFSAFCDRVQRLPACSSREGRPIFHVEKSSDDKRGKRILALGLIHGDESLAGEMSVDWTERLVKLDKHRSTWRFVPLLNPDGLMRKTRMNAAGVDLNRNFPTRDWNDEARPYWEKAGKKDPRRFPGDSAASEPETKCVIAHIKDFKPEFIVSVHTPYKVLDFDGPSMPFPKYRDLPWRALGNFPGSLGRYMWRDYKIPVLTVELGSSMIDSHALQDLIGTFAIDAVRLAGDKKPELYDLL